MIQKVAVGLVAVILVTAAQGAERKRNAPDWKQDARDDICALQGKDDTPAAQAPAQKQQPSLPPLPAAPRPSVLAVPETGIPVVEIARTVIAEGFDRAGIKGENYMTPDSTRPIPDTRHLKPDSWHVDRRLLLAGAGAVALLAGLRWFERSDVEAASSFEITKSDSDWRAILTKAQYEVLRLHRTEVPGSSPLNHEQRKGTFACAGCDLPLFSSETKYDSKTGWPSFYAPLPNAIGTATDHVLLLPRTEVHCRRCGGHLGHVFEDGPPPTGLRYCMNGVAMKFLPDAPA